MAKATLRPVLNDGTLYLCDNGAIYCGKHAGASARYTGRDISGQRVKSFARDDILSAGMVPADCPCERCGATVLASAPQTTRG